MNSLNPRNNNAVEALSTPFKHKGINTQKAELLHLKLVIPLKARAGIQVQAI